MKPTEARPEPAEFGRLDGWISYAREALRGHGAAILVTVADVAGSAPREPGACLVVGPDGAHGNIGGGTLEFSAIAHAGDLLRDGMAAGFELADIALGPGIGQCCGGKVVLAYERLTAADLDVLDALSAGRRGCYLVSEFSDAGRRTWLAGGDEEIAAGAASLKLADAAAGRSCQLIRETGQGRSVLLRVADEPRPHLVLFGAGHVGKALVKVLTDVPVRIVWVDTRPEMFPPHLPATVGAITSAIPESIVPGAPAGAFYLVMTHDHGLDQEICAAILERGDFAFLGLIGSKSKRARFLGQLGERGIAPDALARLTCPIGIGNITGKRPETIAISVAAQLLELFEDEARRHTTEIAPQTVV